MRLSLIMLGAACLAMLGGAYLVAWWTVGMVAMIWGAGLAVFALCRDDGRPAGRPVGLPEPLERWRRSA